ncbi:uncharacterized protein LOC129941434 [Eupeodes corollae]|uniref:uncharacterized protein LOC129941434 n=1 Tax=Eupeodes corollae TaxID=290404 RepID=UPI00249143BE|nr:uncharacterized protein LOC129941434 [Eupeodes corollae]
MEWTRDKTLSLINEYKKRRGLWDMTHEDYRKKEMKHKLLLEVSASLGGGIPIVEIEKKFHTLRTQYHREINRMKRKEPYNSKWFGFKNLQFLSSPKAMRAGKGKMKAEITEDGVTKYIIRDASSRDSEVAGAVAAAASSITTEFLTIHRTKPATTTTTTVTYEPTPATAPTPIAIGRVQKFESNRARDLEKLIEETTKDVEEPEESKTKIIKEINIPMQHHSYSNASIATQEESQSQHQHQHQHQHQEHQIEEEHLSTIDIQTSVDDENMGYHHHHQQHQHQAPARVFKIQRRDTCNEDDYYEEEQQQQSQHQQHIQSKRIYYDNGTSSQVNATMAATSPSALTIAKMQTVQSPRFRDEFATYGEYVANEMRTICNREILISLKHKINTALFEASMAELQQK